MNISSVDQALQLVAWFIALIELIFGLYIVSLNPWHTANRHVSAVLLLIAANVFATGWLLGATDAAQATWPIYIHATTTPAMQVGLFLTTIVLLKPDWLRGRRRWLWWPLYGLWPLSFLLTLLDVRWGTRLWYTGLDASYTGGFASMTSYAAGLLATPFRVLTNYTIPVVIFLLTLYTVLDKRTMPSTRLLARSLLGAQIAVMVIQFGLRGLPVSRGPLLATLLASTFYAVAYAYAAFRQMISERRLQRGRLQVRLTSLVLIVVLPIVVAVVVFASTRAGTLLEQNIATRLHETNYALAIHTSTWLDFNIRALRELVSLPDIVSMDAGRQKPILQAMAAAYPDMYLVSTTDLSGINVARNDDLEPKDYSDREWFRAARDGAPLTFESLVGRTTGTPALVVSMPIRDASGTIVGVGMFASELTSIARAIQAGAVGETGFAYVVDAQNRVVAHPDPAFSAELRDLSAYPPVAALRQGARGPVTFDADGQRWRAYVDQLDNGWGVVVQQTEAEALGTLRLFRQVSWAALAVGTITLLALIWLSVRQILQPISALTDTVTAIAAGDLTRTATVESQDEIGDLALAFNRMTEQLRGLIGNLEQRVAERTADLEKRARYLVASGEIGRAASSILETDQLIRRVVELIRERFALYYVGLFLMDERREWAILRAGTGEAGVKMLSRRHRLLLNEGSMIGWSIVNAQARIAQVAAEDAVRLATPELPDTRSEAALPLRSRGQVIGALTVQSVQAGAFDEATITVLQIMADQVAIALDNARLFTESQTVLESMRRTYGEISGQAWRELLRAQAGLGFQSSESGVTQAEPELTSEGKQALHTGQAVQPSADNGGQRPVAVPVKVRGQVVAVLDTYKPSEAGDWQPEEVALLEALAEQLGQALEGARLYQDSQRRAVREQLVSEVTAHVRETLDMDTVLQTAARAMRDVIDLAEVEVRLGTGPVSDETGHDTEPSDRRRRAA